MRDWRPKILAFACNWEAVSALDLAGARGHSYPAGVRAIPVPCAGRVDPVMVVGALAQGNDGVIVLGCPLGACHYADGNHQAQARLETIKRLLPAATGVSAERVAWSWTASAEGERLALELRQFAEKVERLGPIGAESEETREQVRKALSAFAWDVADTNVRWLMAQERRLLREGDYFGRKVPLEEFDALILRLAERDRRQWEIVQAVADGPLSAWDISERVGRRPDEVLRDIVYLLRTGRVAVERVEDNIPLYVGTGRS
jgi:F420-non-reducing hydrogenase iron-sulfur subunit